MPALHTMWRVKLDSLTIEWLYGRSMFTDAFGKVKKVKVTHDPRTLLRDYEIRESDSSVKYFVSYKAATECLKKHIIMQTISLKAEWVKTRKYERGLSIPKASIT